MKFWLVVVHRPLSHAKMLVWQRNLSSLGLGFWRLEIASSIRYLTCLIQTFRQNEQVRGPLLSSPC